ncbi:adiponectin receptor protein-like isoform X2 [Lineus longissimus]|uniref:adiponectin receptor protein-like isoform X2 n=1 Tax=Lineus longissimus TaxID=88925 RepID=UPI002B4D3285
MASQVDVQAPSTSGGSASAKSAKGTAEEIFKIGDVYQNPDNEVLNHDGIAKAESEHMLQKNTGISAEELDFQLKHRILRKPETEDEMDRAHEILSVAHKAAETAEEFVRHVWNKGWRVCHHENLPKWLRDNEFLTKGHRPELNSYCDCFKSIFRIHTETGNIWTHLLGFVAFLSVAIYFLTRPSIEIQWQDKAVFSAFFAGAILCLGFSWIFHTVYCHSEHVGKLFNKLDYCGIALLTMGSFVPWLYYSFYCRIEPKIAYLVLIFVLGSTCIIVSLWDKFSEPRFRGLRAGVFIGLGLSGVIPAIHYIITDGFWEAINFAALGWLVLMAVLYIVGALIYAMRIPERMFPGKCDIWFQSHQIFHMFVVAAAFVHYHGISEIANYRLTNGDCIETETA